MALRAAKPYDNNGSRQRLVRIPDAIDDWLIGLSRKSKSKNPESRAGIATEINAILRKAFDEAHSRRKA